METGRKTVYRGGTGEITAKKSRFIGAAAHVSCEEEAEAFLETQRKKYYDARHHCSAFICGGSPERKRANDDGEPGGSAGHPILAVLEGGQLHDTIITVTRYFGGTLLGTGGLVRAYTEAAQAALAASETIELFEGLEADLVLDHKSAGRLRYLLETEGIRILQTDYAENVHMKILVPKDAYEKTAAAATRISCGRAVIRKGNLCTYGIRDGEIIR